MFPGLMNLDFCCHIQIVGSKFGIKSVEPTNLASRMHGGCVISFYTLCPLVLSEHSLNTTAYQTIVADHIHPFNSHSVSIT